MVSDGTYQGCQTDPLSLPSSPSGSGLRIAIVHARWNAQIIEALVAGAKKSLLTAGVVESNIVVQSIPGSYELPFAVKR